MAVPSMDEWYLHLLHPQDDQGKRRTALLQAAFDVIAESGFEGLRTRSVAQRAGINIATLHYYFASKQDLIEGLALFIGAKFVTLHGPAPKPSGFPALDRLRQEFSDVRYYLQRQPKMLLVIQEFTLRGKRDPEVQKVVNQMNYYWRQSIGKMVAQGVREGTFRDDIAPPEMLNMLMSILGGTAVVPHDQLGSIERNTEAWILTEKVKKRLKKQKGAKRERA
ncbi:MAG TPA: TetR/AcrR family transcriptional regulator [Bryobacteraceae bacterium]|nr:TetR/AcrR family transcriptional regulator [Bryobacteraceae bacterium]